MKVVSAERINDDRIGLWVCVKFDEPYNILNPDDDEEYEREVGKIVLDYVNKDKEMLNDYINSEGGAFNRFGNVGDAIYIGDCQDYDGCEHWLLE